MSDFTAIREASKSLRDLLTPLLVDPELPSPPVTVSLVSPKELDEVGGLSVWLYRVVRNAELANRPPSRPTPTELRRPPLPLDLYYLVTPLQQEAEADQVLLGRVMQAFHDTPVLRGAALTAPLRADCELRVSLEPQSLEQLSQVWQALQEPYQLSVCYHVQVGPIDSLKRATPVAPVTAHETRYAQILSSS